MSASPQPADNLGDPTLSRRLGIREDSWIGKNQSLVIAFCLIVVLLIISGIREPGFLSAANLRQQIILASFLGTVAAGQTIVILTGGIDLSVAWNLNFAAVLSFYGLPDQHFA